MNQLRPGDSCPKTYEIEVPHSTGEMRLNADEIWLYRPVSGQRSDRSDTILEKTR